jgi:hypothetical protein
MSDSRQYAYPLADVNRFDRNRAGEKAIPLRDFPFLRPFTLDSPGEFIKDLKKVLHCATGRNF